MSEIDSVSKVTSMSEAVKIPWESLDADTLNNLLCEIVTRDGTDYGEHEISTEEKVAQVKRLLKEKKMVIVFDENTESCGLMNAVNLSM